MGKSAPRDQLVTLGHTPKNLQSISLKGRSLSALPCLLTSPIRISMQVSTWIMLWSKREFP